MFTQTPHALIYGACPLGIENAIFLNLIQVYTKTLSWWSIQGFVMFNLSLIALKNKLVKLNSYHSVVRGPIIETRFRSIIYSILPFLCFFFGFGFFQSAELQLIGSKRNNLMPFIYTIFVVVVLVSVYKIVYVWP